MNQDQINDFLAQIIAQSNAIVTSNNKVADLLTKAMNKISPDQIEQTTNKRSYAAVAPAPTGNGNSNNKKAKKHDIEYPDLTEGNECIDGLTLEETQKFIAELTKLVILAYENDFKEPLKLEEVETMEKIRKPNSEDKYATEKKAIWTALSNLVDRVTKKATNAEGVAADFSEETLRNKPMLTFSLALWNAFFQRGVIVQEKEWSMDPTSYVAGTKWRKFITYITKKDNKGNLIANVNVNALAWVHSAYISSSSVEEFMKLDYFKQLLDFFAWAKLTKFCIEHKITAPKKASKAVEPQPTDAVDHEQEQEDQEQEQEDVKPVAVAQKPKAQAPAQHQRRPTPQPLKKPTQQIAIVDDDEEEADEDVYVDQTQPQSKEDEDDDEDN